MRRRMCYNDQVASDCGTYLDNRIMGIISDRLKARLDEMRERHAQTDRELLEARERCYQALNRLKAAADELIDD